MNINGPRNSINPTTFVAISTDDGLRNWLDSKAGRPVMEDVTRCFGHGHKVKVVTPQGNEYELDTREF